MSNSDNRSMFPGDDNQSMPFPIPGPSPEIDNKIPEKLYIIAYKIISNSGIPDDSDVKVNANVYLSKLLDNASKNI